MTESDTEADEPTPSPTTMTKSDTEADESLPIANASSSNVQTSKCSSRTYAQHFASAWLLLPEFKGWLERVKDDDTKAMCRACKKVLTAGKSELRRHSKANSHKRKINLTKGNSLLTVSTYKRQKSFFLNKTTYFRTSLQ